MKARMKFRPTRYRPVKTFVTKRQKRFRWFLAGLVTLILLNFAWDGYKRQAELKEYYGRGKQYYSIIEQEAEKGYNRVKLRIKKLDKKRK